MNYTSTTLCRLTRSYGQQSLPKDLQHPYNNLSSAAQAVRTSADGAAAAAALGAASGAGRAVGATKAYMVLCAMLGCIPLSFPPRRHIEGFRTFRPKISWSTLLGWKSALHKPSWSLVGYLNGSCPADITTSLIRTVIILNPWEGDSRRGG